MNEKPKLKYYMYVSESKVEMLYAQIPKPIQSKLETEVKLNLQILNISFSDKQFEDSFYTKLNTVVEYISNNMNVGSIHSPGEYFRGTLHLRWAHIHPEIVFWGGKLNETVVGLGGSMRHVLGQNKQNIAFPSHSHSAYLADLLMKELQIQTVEPKVNRKLPEEVFEYRILNSVNEWSESLPTRYDDIQKFEFLAKKIRYSKLLDSIPVLLGTPIYVAIAK